MSSQAELIEKSVIGMREFMRGALLLCKALPSMLFTIGLFRTVYGISFHQVMNDPIFCAFERNTIEYLQQQDSP